MTTHTIRIAGKPDETVEGDPFVEVRTDPFPLPAGERFHRLAIWKLESGHWLAARFRQTFGVGEPEEIAETKVIRRDEDDEVPFGPGPTSDAEQLAAMVQTTMRFFEWSWLAKELAEKQAWPIALAR